MMIDEYTLIQPIGKGAFGEVYLTSKEGTNQLFATKKVSKQKADSPSIKKYFLNEITILREINHKNIIHFESIKHTIHNYYIITEFCNGGGLTQCLEKYRKLYGKPFSEQIVQYLMRQIVEALKYLHGKRIIHRDIKLDNILVNFENEIDKNKMNLLNAQIKLIDFGFATHLGNQNLRYSTLGSPINMDPILLKKLASTNGVSNLIGYDEKADIWSLGTVCYEMLIGQGVFNAENMIELIRKVELGTYHVPTNLSKEVVSFLNGMLQYSAKNRLSAEELSRHHFLTKNVKDFKNIDLTKVSHKIDHKGLNINIKRNQSIWAIFKEEDEKTLIDIPGKYLVDAPIKEQDEFSPQKENKLNNPFKNVNNANNIIMNNNINNNVNANINTANINNHIVKNNNIANVNNNIVVNNKQINNVKEQPIDYELLKKQQKLYYQLNLKNNKYNRFANYTYNNPYGFGNINNYNYNNSNYLVNGQLKYYNANLNGNTQINSQTQATIPIQTANNVLVQVPQNNQLLLNQQYPQYQYTYNVIPQYQYIKQNTQTTAQTTAQIAQVPISSQKQNIILPGYQQIPLQNYQNQNIQIQNPIIVPNNNIKDDKSTKKQLNTSKISAISNATTTTVNVPIGSRMPQQGNYIGYPNQKLPTVNNTQKKQNNKKYQQIILQPQHANKNKVKQMLEQNQKLKPHIQSPPQIQKHKDYSNEKQQQLNYIQKKSKEFNLDQQAYIKKYNKLKTQAEIYQNEEPKNNQRHNINNNNNNNQKYQSQKNIANVDNKSNNDNNNQINYQKKVTNNIKVKKLDNETDIQQPEKEKQVEIPLDGKENNYMKSDDEEEFNEPFPMPDDEKEEENKNEKETEKEKEKEKEKENNNKSDNELFQNKKNSKDSNKNDSSDELDDLIDFKLGDELCVEPDSIVENQNNDFNDNEEDNNMDLPMKKIMERTIERPTIGVPPPGTDPKDNYECDNECDGIFQSNHQKEFDNDDFEEI